VLEDAAGEDAAEDNIRKEKERWRVVGCSG